MYKTAVIFPGQGAQVVGMGRDVADVAPEARAVFDRANEILDFDLARLCFEGPAERLNATDVSQPAIFVVSVALWHAMEANGIACQLAPAAMAGLSLGEYTALHLAGFIDFEDCLRLVAERGRRMQAAAHARPGGMVSLIGLDEAVAVRICREAAESEVLVPSNFNCPRQIVVSGNREACHRLLPLAEREGGRAIELAVAGAFHSPLMASAAAGLEPALTAAAIKPGRLSVVANVSADYHGGPADVRSLLREQVVQPVRWQTSIERLIADGVDRFAEVGPGRVLTGLMRKIDRSIKAVNYSTAASLEKQPA
ncbi:MAG: ACP S-malonyltransferase [Phycisphaerae bacterium]